ncbi:MAG: hypothetical protein C6W57_01310 [Caldibacillus debilis]|nr:MAG: hypothetical protein C6W57_01310 [Caldibacillus debilis]REJ31239.1 MAG: hypothetical protein C6W56_00550 [Caldibacillus debilis]
MSGILSGRTGHEGYETAEKEGERKPLPFGTAGLRRAGASFCFFSPRYSSVTHRDFQRPGGEG